MGIIIGIGQTRPQAPYDQYYGIEWDVTVSNPRPKRIGKMELHASLPVQSLMRRCVLRDSGEIAYYLDENDSTMKEGGAPAKLDGTDGQVMVEIPAFYMRFESEGNKRRCLMSQYQLPGFLKWDRMFISAYEATIHRPSGKLSSVLNLSPDYRGGDNDASKDNKPNSLLGKPASGISLIEARRMARERGGFRWNCHTYKAQKTIFWLFAVEYCNFNSQDPIDNELDENGCRRGGLGDGPTTHNSYDSYGQLPKIPCGVTNSLGNRSGEIKFTLEPVSTRDARTSIKAISYRGIENVFGHTWSATDGAKCIAQSDEEGGQTKLYTCNDPAKWSDTGLDGYDFCGVLARSNGFSKELVLGDRGEIIPYKVGAGSTTFFCDYIWSSVPSSGSIELCLWFGGNSNDGGQAGLACSAYSAYSHQSSIHVGTRLCYIP